jgi:hypothetical protein
MKKEHFVNCNGYSNVFFGWGGEDDDHFNRLKHKNYSINFQPEPLGRYFMAKHQQEDPNPDRFKKLFEGDKRYNVEGLNSVKYKLLETKKTPLYTKYLIEYNRQELDKPY